MLGSILSLFNMIDINKYSVWQQIVLIAEMVLGVFLLWWLNTQSAKTYFGKSKENA